MENNATEFAQDAGNNAEASQAIQVCLRSPVILRGILEHFSSTELLRVSLVNKFWKFEARSLLRRRRDLIANVRSNLSPWDRYEAAQAFISDLPQLGDAPFSGISFNYFPKKDARLFPHWDRVHIHDENLDQLLLKSVSVKILGPWLELRDSPAFLLVKKILAKFCCVLEELELNISNEEEDFIDKFVQDCNFPRLQNLKVVTWALSTDDQNYMKALLLRAKNLKMLYTNWNTDSTLELLEGTSVELVDTTSDHPPFDYTSVNAISAILSDDSNLEYPDGEFNLEPFTRITPTLMQAPCTSTLRKVSMDAVLAVPLMCNGTPFENVEHLRMNIDYGHLERNEPRILRIVKNFNFTRLFPNLNKVIIFYEDSSNVPELLPKHMNELIEQANAILMEPNADRAVGVKELVLHLWNPSSAAAQFFVEMFPNIEKLEMITGTGASEEIPFGFIWNWLDLKELQVRGNVLPRTGNLDSVFCGIFPEEVAELREKDEKYLKRVNIVPVMPAVTSLRNLTAVSLNHQDPRYAYLGAEATFLFSKVTTLLVLARWPTLGVQLAVPRYTRQSFAREMTHLGRYVSLTPNLREDEELYA